MRSGITKQDNSTFDQKIMIRRTAMKKLVEPPVIMETHAGDGEIWATLYAECMEGIAFDTDPTKAEKLAINRPTWAIYEADSQMALENGLGAHLPINYLDVDAYGDPWPTIEAFFSSERPFPRQMVIAVNDGMRQSVRIGIAWKIDSLSKMVSRFGNNLNARYLDVCECLMEEKAAAAGYSVQSFAGYHCGALNQVTHYVAVLTQ